MKKVSNNYDTGAIRGVRDSTDGLIILAGGKSARMGRDKWSLLLGTESVQDRIIRILGNSGLFRELMLVRKYMGPDQEPGKDCSTCADSGIQTISASSPGPGWTELRLEAGRTDLRFIRDEVPDAGPLGGLISALRRASCSRVLATAGDMPFPSIKVAERLLTRSRESGAMAVLPEWNGRLHPLFAVYRADCLPGLQAYLACGGRKVMEWLKGLDAMIYPEEEIREIDPDGRALFNMNTPADYERALALFHSDEGAASSD